MKRIVKIGIAVVAAIVMMGVVSCGGGNNPPPAGDDATLTSVLFGTEVATLGTPAATFAAAVAGSVTILQASVNITATPTSEDAELQYAKVDSDGKYTNTDGELVDFDEDALWYDTSFEFETGDELVIQVTHGSKVLYYRIAVTYIKVALGTLKVGGNDVTLPAGGTSWQTAGSGGFVLFDYLVTAQPAGGIAIVATPKVAEEGEEELEEVTITFGKAVGNAQPTFGTETSFTFADDEFLYVKVTGNVTGATAYYKVKINFKRDGRIKYGSPVIGYGANGADRGTNGLPTTPGTAGYIDPKWNDADLEVYPINRVYSADSGSFLDPNNHFPETIATAKVMWDEEGLSVYVKVIDADVSTVDNEHNKDSFELFINEDLTATGTGAQKYSNGGSQYRVAANGQRSGEGQSPAAMNALNKTTGWRTDDGYIVIMKAPWRLRNKFFSPTTYRNDWNFGFELQINASGVTETRYAVLVWNNIAHTNYQNAADYGNAKLYGQTGTLNFPAVPPTITTQPAGTVVEVGDSVTLTIATSVPSDNGVISYKWYESTTAAGEGTEITSGISDGGKTLTLTFAGTKYYYAMVTNTVTGTGAPNTVKSAVAGIINADEIVLTDTWVEKVTMKGTCAPLYGFKLPAGKTFGDYDRIKVTFRMDKASENMNGRLRAWGNFPATAYTPGNTPAQNGNVFGSANASPGGLLLNTNTNVVYDGEWVNAEIVFGNRDALTAAATIKAETGVILLAFAPVPNNSGTNNGDNTRTYYVKNITLTNTAGDEIVKVLHPAHPLLWGGKGQAAYVTQDNGAGEKAVRQLYDWVDKVHMVNTSVPLYGFNLPAGKTFGDYTKIKINMKMDDASVSGRLRVFGTYEPSVYVPGASSQASNMQNASPGGLLIGSSDAGSSFTNVWTVYERAFNNRDAIDTSAAVKASSGVILLGIGPIPGAGASATKDYYVMGITLENDDGTQVVNAMSPDNTLLWAGNGKGAFVTGNGNDQMTRTLQPIDYTNFDPAP